MTSKLAVVSGSGMNRRAPKRKAESLLGALTCLFSLVFFCAGQPVTSIVQEVQLVKSGIPLVHINDYYSTLPFLR